MWRAVTCAILSHTSLGLGHGLWLRDVLSLSRELSEPFLTASHGLGYPGSAGVGLRLQAELLTSLITVPTCMVATDWGA
jgi:hypothetical protein